MSASGGGSMVNISSLGGIRPWAMHAHYCASKAGVIHMTRALAKAFAPSIRVNSVAPGVIPFDEVGESRQKGVERGAVDDPYPELWQVWRGHLDQNRWASSLSFTTIISSLNRTSKPEMHG